MSIGLMIALYFVIWWTLLFAVLPWGVRTQGEAGEVVPGTPASAPVSVRMARVVLINSLLSALVLALIWLVVTRGWIQVGGGAGPV